MDSGIPAFAAGILSRAGASRAVDSLPPDSEGVKFLKIHPRPAHLPRKDNPSYFTLREKARIHDLQAPIPHLLGLYPEKPSHHCAGYSSRLTDVNWHEVQEISA